MKPTNETYQALQDAFSYFNRNLFNDELPPVVFVMQKKKGVLGHFHGKTWGNTEGTVVDEISLNPDSLIKRSKEQVLSTLVHEMVHLQQSHFGKPSRNGYHNAEWGGMMEKVGLMPSSTGDKDGKRTGQKMTHYIIPGGPFDTCTWNLLNTGFDIPWKYIFQDLETAKKKRESKTKYTCPECGLNAWGKPEIEILCGDCRVQLEPGL